MHRRQSQPRTWGVWGLGVCYSSRILTVLMNASARNLLKVYFHKCASYQYGRLSRVSQSFSFSSVQQSHQARRTAENEIKMALPALSHCFETKRRGSASFSSRITTDFAVCTKTGFATLGTGDPFRGRLSIAAVSRLRTSIWNRW